MLTQAFIRSWAQGRKLHSKGKSPKLSNGRHSYRPLVETLEDRTLLAADLQITKIDDLASVVPGASITYDIVVTNAGPDDVTGAVVADVLPTALTGATFTATGTGGAVNFDASGSGDINDTVDLPSGSSITYVVTATISADATGTLVNTATVSAPVGVDDSDLANNTATDINLVLASGTAVVTTDPSDPTQSILLVTGTAKSDHIAISLTEDDQIQVMLKRQVLGTFDPATFSGIVIFAQAGNDHVVVGSGVTAAMEIHGDAGNDHLAGGDGDDEIFGDAGNDLLVGNGGNDLLDGGDGNDRLLGGLGDDEILGGAGNDNLLGGDGDNTLDGGAGHNNLHGQALAAILAEESHGKSKKPK